MYNKNWKNLPPSLPPSPYSSFLHDLKKVKILHLLSIMRSWKTISKMYQKRNRNLFRFPIFDGYHVLNLTIFVFKTYEMTHNSTLNINGNDECKVTCGILGTLLAGILARLNWLTADQKGKWTILTSSPILLWDFHTMRSVGLWSDCMLSLTSIKWIFLSFLNHRAQLNPIYIGILHNAPFVV